MQESGSTAMVRVATLAVAVLGLGCSASFGVGCSSSPNGEVGELPADRSPGTFLVGLEHDGLQREFIAYVPETYDATADTPLVLNFHGFEGGARYHLEDSDLRPQADRAGAILLVPQGAELDGSPHWNPSRLGGDNKSSVDDFGFVEAMLNEVQAAYPYNADRVSAVGYSNGGMMAMGLACERSHLIASAGVMSGTMLDVGCELSHPISVISIHGTRDDTIPYDGNGDYRSALDVVDYWRGANETENAEEVTFSDGGTSISHWAYEGGTAGTAVHHYRVDRGYHVWLQFTADGQSSNDRIWNFLTAYSVNGSL